MSTYDSGPNTQNRPPIRSGVLWAGGLATAVVAALVAGVGVVVCQGVLSVDLLPIGLPGEPDAPNWIAYPVIGAILALAATGALHLLLVLVPQPIRFFNWIIALVAVLAAALPFAGGLSFPALATSVVDLLTVLAISLLLSGTGYRARRTDYRAPPNDPVTP